MPVKKAFKIAVLLPAFISCFGAISAYSQPGAMASLEFDGVVRGEMRLLDLMNFRKSDTRLVPPVPVPEKVREYKLVPAQSSVLFSGKAGGITLEGKFTSFKAHVLGNPSDIASAVINVTIYTASTQMNLKPLNPLARKMLATDRYPEATLKTIAIRSTSVSGAYTADVEINLKGTKYLQTIPVRIIMAAAENIRVKGTAPLKLGPNLSGTVRFDVLLSPVN